MNTFAMIGGLRRLLLLGVCLPAMTVQAQLSLPGLANKGAKQPSAELSVGEQKSRIEATLADIEQQRNQVIHNLPESGSEAGTQTLEQKRLLDRLLVLQSERLKRLGDIAAHEEKDAALPVLASPLIKEFDREPPYSALHVDALRDELDGLRDRYQALGAGLAIREAEQQERQAQLQRLAEAVRLATDKHAQSRDVTAQESIRQQLVLANLRKQVAEAELSAVALDQDVLKKQSVRLKAQIDAMDALVLRALPHQRLSENELDEQRARVRAQQDELAAEIETLTAVNARHVRERESLLAKPSANTDRMQQRRAYLDRVLETDTELLQGLRGLKLLLDATRDAWESRYVTLSAENPQTRQKAVATLNKFQTTLVNRKRLLQEMRDTTRAAIREQENRLANLQQDADTFKQEQQLLALLRNRASIYERLERTASHFERQLSRWSADLAGEGGHHSWAMRASGLGVLVKQSLATAWNYELFAVEDVSEVDGRAVSVSYGVTVGKSVGALALFSIGYWLFALLARMLEQLLIRRFRLEPQLAIVIRRWVLITFSALLVIFVLNLARIPLTVFAFMGGALAIGVGFGTQTIIKNFISGIIILIERKIRVGDIIESGGMTGQVTAVDLRATTVRGFDGVEALVPNSNFLENQVINWTYSNHQVRREIKIGVAYGCDTRAVAEILKAVADHNSDVLSLPAPDVLFEDFGDSALQFALVYWVEMGLGKTARKIDSELRHAVSQELATAGITIPFPQSDIHFDSLHPLRVVVVQDGNPVGHPSII